MSPRDGGDRGGTGPPGHEDPGSGHGGFRGESVGKNGNTSFSRRITDFEIENPATWGHDPGTFRPTLYPRPRSRPNNSKRAEAGIPLGCETHPARHRMRTLLLSGLRDCARRISTHPPTSPWGPSRTRRAAWRASPSPEATPPSPAR
jgi:hypothetical protein